MVGHCAGGWGGPLFVTCRSSDYDAFAGSALKTTILQVGQTRGQADTVRQALEAADILGPFVVVNSDNAFRPASLLPTFVESCLDGAYPHGAMTIMVDPLLDGSRYGFVSGHPEYGYGLEKKPASKFALAGAFFFRSGAEFVWAYERLMAGTTGDYAPYLSSIFAHLGIGLSYVIPRDCLHEWGTWQDLERDPAVSNIRW